ncbi:LamG domain-containing protein [Patescibacteria group bacterium]|nr:LamG domain-containing protein [Candidatus Falkowbacteria bacterium]MBU3906375.1 LamG domain-containing protein [Patescibacteria group bacterium]MBU4015449.1 LamG domain-containing protein [Patescibacteria group bacterium]MBU4026765.1 LamG domain-containing protein [Patescibacteria group bacterium]MBU4072559.1 LamG domain-containing protein [Patescibacteria group bacterium]
MFNKSKCQIKNLTILAPSAAAALGAVVFISVFLFSAGQAKAVDYYNEGILKSTNVLSGASVTAINSFTVTSSMAATASTSAQFSQDRVNFYSSAGVKGEWDSCSDGATEIDLSGLGWSGELLFYKLKLETSDASTTPSVADIQVDYDGTEVPADSGIRYHNEGFLVSEDLLAGLSGNLNGSEKFGYNITSLPAGSAVHAQFSQDGENWYNSSGTKWGWDTLSVGSHLEKASALGLSGLGWSGDNFYYKLKFTSIDGEQTPAVSEISLLKSATQINAPITNKSSGGLVGDWTFNGPDMDWASTTAEALDRSGEANNGNVIGAKAAIGISGQGLEFDGADDYIDCGNVYNGIKTISFWIKADSITEKIIDLNGTADIEVVGGTITANNFSQTIYVDGSLGSTIDAEWHYISIATSTGINAGAVDIGRIGADYFDGILDEVRFYDYALSADEILKHYRVWSRTMKIDPAK